MNIKPVFFTPKNDKELDAYIESINSAYTNTFNFHVGPKRSEKLRDAICVHLGYPNGYQQLKAHWDSLDHYDVLKDPENRGMLIHSDVMGNMPIALVFNEISTWLVEKLRDAFPCKVGGFMRGDEVPTSGRKGWGIQIPTDVENNTKWVPLYIGSVQIGYANSYSGDNKAIMMQAMLTGLMNDLGSEVGERLRSSCNEAWLSSLEKHDIDTLPNLNLVLSLRMDSMSSSLLFPLQSNVVIGRDELSFKMPNPNMDKNKPFKHCHIDAVKSNPNGELFFDGIAFDFVNIYNFSADGAPIYMESYEGTNENNQRLNVKPYSVESLDWNETGFVEVRIGHLLSKLNLSGNKKMIILMSNS